MSGLWCGPGPVAQLLGHLPILKLSDQIIHGVRMVVGQYPTGVRRQLTYGVVYNTLSIRLGPSPVVSHLFTNPPSCAICPYHAPDVESPIVEALSAGREVMSVERQDCLFEGGVLSGSLRWQVLARLLGRTGEERCHNVCSTGQFSLWAVRFKVSRYASTSSSGRAW